MIGRVLYLLVLVLLSVAPAAAQFRELATTDDGRQLYLASSLMLDDAAPPTYSETRIYRVARGDVRLIAERGARAPADSRSGGDGVSRPQVSGDGGTVGFTYHNVCTGEDPCAEAETLSELQGRYAGVLGPGSLQLSRNGRWALLKQDSDSPATLVDLRTGRRTAVPASSPDTSSLASDGSVLGFQRLASQGRAFGVWRAGRFTPIHLKGPIAFFPLALSDDARQLIYVGFRGLPSTEGPLLIVRDLLSNTETVLVSPEHPGRIVEFLGWSNTGRWVLGLVRDPAGAGTVFVADTLMNTNEPISMPAGEFAATGTISGFGNRVYIVTSVGRILKFELAAGRPYDSETIVPPTPHITRLDHLLSPGSLVRLRGAVPGTAEELSDHFLLDGKPLPVLFVSAGEVGVQVPWEQPTGRSLEFVLDLRTASPFRQRELVSVGPFAPRFEPLEPGETGIVPVKLVKGDFSGPLDERPRSGDIIHGYFTGLGAVEGNVETGVPVPDGAVLPIRGTLRCSFLPRTADLITLFAGLAPGMVGVYQVSFLVPPDFGDRRIDGMRCELNTAYGGSSFGVFGALGQPRP